jgi:hypothetical protein
MAESSLAGPAPQGSTDRSGARWHPVRITDPVMHVAASPLPLVTVLAVIRGATPDHPSRHRADALQTFRCT